MNIFSIFHVQAPAHYEKSYPLKVLSDHVAGLEQVTLGLHFTVNNAHFQRGKLPFQVLQ